MQLHMYVIMATKW